MNFCNFESFLKNEWIISSDTKSKWISYLVCLYGWAICVRYIGAVFISDPIKWNLIGDPFYCTGDRILFNTILFGISVFGSLFRTAFILGQKTDSFMVIMKILNLRPDSDHSLTSRHVKKLKIVSKICSLVILRMIRQNLSSTFCAVYVFYCIVAYYSKEQYFSVVPLVMWFIILQTWAHFITSPIVVCYAMLYFTVFYLKLKFHQLNQRFAKIQRSGALHRLIVSVNLLDMFEAHNRLSIFTLKYNQFFKYLIFINHFCVTSNVTLKYYIFFYGSSNLFLRSANLIVGAMETFMIFLMTRFTANLSKESIAFYSNINSFVCRHPLTYRTRMKIENFIGWISGPSIGFYCLDIFPITSFGFFKYFLNCLANFLLLVGLFRKYFGYY